MIGSPRGREPKDVVLDPSARISAQAESKPYDMEGVEYP